MSIINTDQWRFSLGVPAGGGNSPDHRYIFPLSFKLISDAVDTQLEENKPPLRDFIVLPVGRSGERIIRIGGVVGGTGGQGGWFSGEAAAPGNPASSFYSEGPITNKDDLEAVLQRIANVCLYRGFANLRVGHNDDRYIPVLLKKLSVAYIEGTDRMAGDVELDFVAPEPWYRSASINTATDNASSGTLSVTVGGTAKCWPEFDVDAGSSGSGTQIWVRVNYLMLPGSPVITVQFIPQTNGGFQIITDPRRRGIWRLVDPKDIDELNNQSTATMNFQNTVGDGELMPYFLPGTQTVDFSMPGVGITAQWAESNAF